MKVCLFGGTFDPPHLGHLILAQTIFEAEHFDQIVFVPAHTSPHKEKTLVSSIDLRKEIGSPLNQRRGPGDNPGPLL